VTLLVVEERIKDNGVRINNKIAGIKDPLFDTFIRLPWEVLKMQQQWKHIIEAKSLQKFYKMIIKTEALTFNFST